MKKQIKFKRFTLCVLSLIVLLVLFSVPNVALSATEKPELNKKTMTIPIGKYGKNSGWSVKDKNGEENYMSSVDLLVNNKIKGASYTFVSNNTSVVTIGKTGGFVVGQKSGTATITCKQTYKKKVSVVGICKVTVKQSSVMGTQDLSDISLGKQLCGTEWFGNSDGYGFYPAPYQILYRNLNATYSFLIDKKGFTIKEDKLTKEEIKEGFRADYSQMITRYTASKVGTYKVSVVETFKGKKRTIGTFTIKVHDVEIINKTLELGLNSTASKWSFLHYLRDDKEYYFSVDNSDNVGNDVIQLIHDDNIGLEIKGIKVGTATINIYEDSEKGRFLGSCQVNVYEKPAESIELEENSDQVIVGYERWIDFTVNPRDTTDLVEVTSSNPEVLKVELDYGNQLHYEPLKVGVAVITLRVGKVTKDITIKVVDAPALK